MFIEPSEDIRRTKTVEATGYRRLTAEVETEPLRGEETEPREVFLLLV